MFETEEWQKVCQATIAETTNIKPEYFTGERFFKPLSDEQFLILSLLNQHPGDTAFDLGGRLMRKWPAYRPSIQTVYSLVKGLRNEFFIDVESVPSPSLRSVATRLHLSHYGKELLAWESWWRIKLMASLVLG